MTHSSTIFIQHMTVILAPEQATSTQRYMINTTKSKKNGATSDACFNGQINLRSTWIKLFIKDTTNSC